MFANIENVTIHAPAAGHNYCHDPTIVRFQGQFWAAWQGGPENREGGNAQAIWAATSTDFRSWSAPFPIAEPTSKHVLFAPVLWVWGEQLCLTYLDNKHDPAQSTEAKIRWGPLILRHWDGRQWSEAKCIADPDEAQGVPAAASVVNKPIVVRKSGAEIGERLILPLQYINDDSVVRDCAALLSDDGGRTFRVSERVPTCGYRLFEPSVIELPGGRLAMYMRAVDDDFIWCSCSDDGGEHWHEAERTRLLNPGKTAVCALSGGGYLMCYNDLLHTEPGASGPIARRRNLTAAVSEDGLTFQPDCYIDTESNGFGISYPDMCEHEGRVYAITSRRNDPSVHRPNMARGHVLEKV